MPQVASALKNHAANRLPAARPPQSPGRSPPTPFASLFDDNAPAPERTPHSPADDRGARARSDQAQQPAKSTDGKAVKTKDAVGSSAAGKDANAGEDAKADNVAKTDKTDQTAVDTKIVTDAKIAKPTEGKDATPVNDGKPADDLVATEAATAPSTDPQPTVATAETTVAVLPPAAGNAATPAIPATPATPTKAGTLAAPQTGRDKADNGAVLAAEAMAQPHGEAKPQGHAGLAADKDAIAQARGEAPHGEHANTAHLATPAQANAALAADAMTAAPKAGIDVAPPLAHTAPLQTTASAGPNPTASAPMPQPAVIPFAGVAIEIAGKALAGKNHFEIRLDPPELGRIEVRLEVDRDGNVISRMIADRADTLDLLRRDAGGLDRALQDAGLKTSDNSLQFSLRDQSAQQERADRASDSARLVVEDDMPPASDNYSRLAGLGSGVDIHV